MKSFRTVVSLFVAGLFLVVPTTQASVRGLFETGTNCVPTGKNISAIYNVQGALIGHNFLDTTVVCPARVDSFIGLDLELVPSSSMMLVNVTDTPVSNATITCKARSTSADNSVASVILDTKTSAGDSSAQTLVLDISGHPSDLTSVLTVECSVPNAAQIRSYGLSLAGDIIDF